ncbi:epoxide hydrolase [Cladorrhinum sp. PSN332]|nr:epoxide hydrolase [Cladorrhinum sp. PSN332]
MAEAVIPPAAAAAQAVDEEEVKPYKVHIPSKHLDLTRQKLELARLPHQGAEPQIEPLIDYWLESYSFRDTESKLNNTIPQFRTSLPVSPASSSSESIRIHFIHSSPSPNATPLLLLPPFPLTNLSIYPHLPASLTSEYSIVIPSYPGIGFSDSLLAATTIATSVLEATAHLFNTLMTTRLNYKTYLVSVSSPNKIDNLLAQQLVTDYPESCIGANLISPPLSKPTFEKDPWEWSKYLVARFFRGGVAGYAEEDFGPQEKQQKRQRQQQRNDEESGRGGGGGGGGLELQEPDTISYALCDSPVGTLAAVVKGLKGNGTGTGTGEGKKFSEEELVTLTNLAWLPGPEGAVRFGVAAAVGRQEKKGFKAKDTKKGKGTVSVTVFVGGGEGKEKYCPPAWANTEYVLAHTQRVKGGSSSNSSSNGLLLVFERPEVIFDGLKGLADGIEKLDAKKKKEKKKNEGGKKSGGEATVPFEGVVVVHPATEQEQVITPPEQVIQPPLELSAVSSPDSGDTAVAGTSPGFVGSSSKPSPSGGADLKGKGKAATTTTTTAGDYLQPPAPIRGDTMSSEGESPDTLVENSPPPLERV